MEEGRWLRNIVANRGAVCSTQASLLLICARRNTEGATAHFALSKWIGPLRQGTAEERANFLISSVYSHRHLFKQHKRLLDIKKTYFCCRCVMYVVLVSGFSLIAESQSLSYASFCCCFLVFLLYLASTLQNSVSQCTYDTCKCRTKHPL